MKPSKIFRYSRWDAVCAVLIPLHIAFYVAVAFYYAHASGMELALLAIAFYALSLQNAGINHNHYHTPYFRSKALNEIARVGLSMTATPKTPYNVGHGLHHADQLGEDFNRASALKILGLHRPFRQQVLGFLLFYAESLGIKYLALIILLRFWTLDRLAVLAMPSQPHVARKVLEQIVKPTNLRRAKREIYAWIAFRLLLLTIDWRFFLFYFVPVTYVIEVSRQIDNYTQHWGASDTGDPLRDSVSCYGTAYNLLTFNLGYHQEHHLRPAAHWMTLPEVRRELPTDRRTVPFIHYVNVPLFYPALAASLARRDGPVEKLWDAGAPAKPSART